MDDDSKVTEDRPVSNVLRGRERGNFRGRGAKPQPFKQAVDNICAEMSAIAEDVEKFRYRGRGRGFIRGRGFTRGRGVLHADNRDLDNNMGDRK